VTASLTRSSPLRLIGATLSSVLFGLATFGVWTLGLWQHFQDYCVTRVSPPAQLGLEFGYGPPGFTFPETLITCQYTGGLSNSTVDLYPTIWTVGCAAAGLAGIAAIWCLLALPHRQVLRGCPCCHGRDRPGKR